MTHGWQGVPAMRSGHLIGRRVGMRKKTWIAGAVFLLIVAGILGGIKLVRVYKARQCGIVLAFDDYNPESWEQHFDLFDEYDAKVTFFVNCSEPTDFCYDAIERGHDIGFHTIGHVNLKEVSEEEVYQQAIEPIEVFREHGIELTSFAYPYGGYNESLNELLQQHYKVLRGAYYYQLVGKDKMRQGFVESFSIDNVNYSSDEEFQQSIDAMLEELGNNTGAVVGLYSHAIGVGNWCISEERLEYILKRGKEMGIRFYTFRELQEN